MSSVVGPFIVVWATGRQNRKSKEQDYARLDDVAAKASRAAALAEHSAQANLDANQQTADSLHQVHVLLNSEKTEGMRREAAAYEAQLVLLRQVMALNEAAGRRPREDDGAVLLTLERRIKELNHEIELRLAQQAPPI